VEDAIAWVFFSDLVAYIAAVTPAPVAALTAAMIARVVLDMMEEVRDGPGRDLYISLGGLARGGCW